MLAPRYSVVRARDGEGCGKKKRLKDALFKRPFRNAATAQISGDDIVGLRETRGFDAGVGRFETVAAHAGHVSVEEGGVDGVGGCAAPVPVLGAFRQYTGRS